MGCLWLANLLPVCSIKHLRIPAEPTEHAGGAWPQQRRSLSSLYASTLMHLHSPVSPARHYGTSPRENGLRKRSEGNFTRQRKDMLGVLFRCFITNWESRIPRLFSLWQNAQISPARSKLKLRTCTHAFVSAVRGHTQWKTCRNEKSQQGEWMKSKVRF